MNFKEIKDELLICNCVRSAFKISGSCDYELSHYADAFRSMAMMQRVIALQQGTCFDVEAFARTQLPLNMF